jgi:flagellar biosynthetic protein FliQ
MTPEMVIDVGQQALQVVIAMLGLLLLPALGVGLIISMFQAATQINEVTLSFIPKLLITLLMLVIGGPWMLRVIINFTEKLISNIPSFIG